MKERGRITLVASSVSSGEAPLLLDGFTTLCCSSE